MNGLKAPCGHPGVPVIGTFVNCTVKGCDGLPPIPVEIEEETTERIIALHPCPKCGSLDTAPYSHPWFGKAQGGRRCIDCGCVF